MCVPGLMLVECRIMHVLSTQTHLHDNINGIMCFCMVDMVDGSDAQTSPSDVLSGRFASQIDGGRRYIGGQTRNHVFGARERERESECERRLASRWGGGGGEEVRCVECIFTERLDLEAGNIFVDRCQLEMCVCGVGVVKYNWRLCFFLSLCSCFIWGEKWILFMMIWRRECNLRKVSGCMFHPFRCLR